MFQQSPLWNQSSPIHPSTIGVVTSRRSWSKPALVGWNLAGVSPGSPDAATFWPDW